VKRAASAVNGKNATRREKAAASVSRSGSLEVLVGGLTRFCPKETVAVNVPIEACYYSARSKVIPSMFLTTNYGMLGGAASSIPASNGTGMTPSPMMTPSLFSSVLKRGSVLEIPVDENNVPQIDQAITPPPLGVGVDMQGGGGSGIVGGSSTAAQQRLGMRLGGLGPGFSFMARQQQQYNRRFASLRIQKRTNTGFPGERLGGCGLGGHIGSLRSGKESGKSQSITLGQQQNGQTRGSYQHLSASDYFQKVHFQNIGNYDN